MAEVLAVAASGAGLASLALQLLDCGVKLSKFCDEVEKAPKRLRRISGEMKTLGLTLQQMELLRIQYSISNTHVLAQCIELCEDSVRDIIDSTKAIEAVVMRHRLGGRIYAAFRMPDVTTQCSDMERAKTSLMLALQLFQTGLQGPLITTSLTLSTQIATLSALQHPAPPSSAARPTSMSGTALIPAIIEQQPIRSSFNKDVAHDVNRRQTQSVTTFKKRLYGASKRAFGLRVQLPSWLSQNVWDISVLHSYGRWDICLQCENVVPFWSPVFRLAEDGNVLAVRKLFQEGKASPYDTVLEPSFRRGNSIFEAAAFTFSTEFYAMALEFMYPAHRGRAAQDLLGRFQRKRIFDTSPKFSAAASYLVESQAIDLVELISSTDDWFLGDYGITFLPDLQRNQLEFRRYWTPNDWFNFLTFNHSLEDLTATILYQYCGTPDDYDDLNMLRDDRGRGVLHLIAQIIPSLIATGKNWQCERGWLQLFYSLLATHTGFGLLHSVSHDSLDWGRAETPFMVFLSSFYQHWKPWSTSPFTTWARLLKDTHVDVEKFFRDEIAVWKDLASPIGYLGRTRFEIRGIYKDELTAAWRGCYSIDIPIYKSQMLPGAWPESRYIPTTICWSPNPRQDRNGGAWRRVDELKMQISERTLTEQVILDTGTDREWSWWPHRSTKYEKLGKALSDDREVNEGLGPYPIQARSHRRTRSEPPTLIQAYNARSGPEGRLKHCSIHSRWRIRMDINPPGRSGDQCRDERCCRRWQVYTSDRWAFDRFGSLAKACRRFERVNHVPPARCWHVLGPIPGEMIATTIDTPLVSGRNVLSAAFDVENNKWEYDGCRDFPECEHQKVFLEHVQQNPGRVVEDILWSGDRRLVCRVKPT